MLDETKVLTDVYRIIKARNSRYFDMPDWDDAVQEAAIRAWKDMQEGNEDFPYLVNRANNWAKVNLFNNGTHHPTGWQGRSRGFIPRKSGEIAREKIRQYKEEYKELHGTDPSGAQIARGIGMDERTVLTHLKVLRNPGVTPILKEGEGNNLDFKAYTTTSLVTEQSEEAEAWASRVYPSTPSHEDEVITEMTLLEHLRQMENENHAAVLVLVYWYGYSERQAGQALGVAQYTAHRWKMAGLAALKEVLI